MSSKKPADTNATNFVTSDESTGNAELDQRLAEPVFRGDKGIDAAQVWFCAILGLVVGLLVFSNILSIPLQGADVEVLSNPDNIGLLPGFTLWLNSVLGGASAGYRAVNLLLHLVNGLLLFIFFKRIIGPAKPTIAMAGAMFFTVHPLVTEAVVTLSGRSFILCTTFILAGLLAYERAWQKKIEENGGESFSFTVLPFGFSMLFFVLAWACSATAAIMPPLVIALDILLHGKSRLLKRLPAIAAYWLTLAGLIGVTISAGRVTGLFSADAMPMANLLGLLFWPLALSVVHSTGSTSVDYAMVAAVLAGGAALLACRKAGGLALIWVALALLLNIAGAGERAGYIIVAGAALLVPRAFMMQRRSELRAAAGFAMTGLILAAGVATYMRDLEWQDEMRLWLDASEKAPESSRPAAEIGRILLLNAQMSADREIAAQAEQYLKSAIEGRSDPDVQTLYRYAVAVAMQARDDEAIELFLQVLAKDVNNRHSLVAAADLLAARHEKFGSREDIADAVEFFRKADEIKPLTGFSLANYAQALIELGEFELAEAPLRRLPESYAGLQKRNQEMLQHIRNIEQQKNAVAAKNPQDPAIAKLQAQILVLKGKFLPAGYRLQESRQGRELDFASWLMTGVIRAKMGSEDTFLAEHSMPPQKPAGVTSVWLELAKACAAADLWDGARNYLESQSALQESQTSPLLALSELAFQMKSANAIDLLEQAAQACPNDPIPCLHLADLAILGNNPAEASKFLDQAQKRGAPAKDIEDRRTQIHREEKSAQ